MQIYIFSFREKHEIDSAITVRYSDLIDSSELITIEHNASFRG